MNSIITTATSNSTLTMSSREIAELTGKRHDHVIRDIEKMLDNVGINRPKFGGVYLDAKGEERKCYNLPKNLTLNLVLGYRDDLRLKVVDRWLELEAQNVPTAPQNMVEALTLALEQQKALAAKEEEIAELAPKAAALDAISEADGDMGVRDAGRELDGIGQTKVVAYLLEHKWACREGRKLKPAHYGSERGYCRLVSKPYQDRHTGETCVGHDFKITARGLARLAIVLCGVNSEAARRLNGTKEQKATRKPFMKTPA